MKAVEGNAFDESNESDVLVLCFWVVIYLAASQSHVHGLVDRFAESPDVVLHYAQIELNEPRKINCNLEKT